MKASQGLEISRVLELVGEILRCRPSPMHCNSVTDTQHLSTSICNKVQLKLVISQRLQR